jgi:hypothetical protein
MADFRLFQSRGGGRSSSGESRTIPFALLWTIALLFGLQVGALSFFVPKLFHLQYGSEGLGGDASFLLGLCGGLISYLYAYLAERRGSGHYRVALFTSIAAVVPLFAFFHFTGSGAKTAAMAAAGLTVGGAFPMLASLARRSRGFTVGMRSALMLGGVWGVVTLVNMVLARLADRVELATGDPLAIEGIVGYIRFVPFVLAPMLWFAMKRYED